MVYNLSGKSLGDSEDQRMKKNSPQNAKRVLQDVICCKRAFLVSQLILWSAKAHHFFHNKHILIRVFCLRRAALLIFPSVVTLHHSLSPFWACLWLVADVCCQSDQFVTEITHSPTCFIFFLQTGTIKISSGACGIVVAVPVIFCPSLTCVLGRADHCIPSSLNLTGP